MRRGIAVSFAWGFAVDRGPIADADGRRLHPDRQHTSPHFTAEAGIREPTRARPAEPGS